MRASYFIEKPNDVELTLSITLKLSEWDDLARQLPSKWPSTQFGNEIMAMIYNVNKKMTVTNKDDPATSETKLSGSSESKTGISLPSVGSHATDPFAQQTQSRKEHDE